MALGFSNGNTDMDAYIDFIVARLIESTQWVDADAGTFPAGAAPANRIIRDAGSTIFIRFQRIVTNGNSNGAGAQVINGTGTGRWNEIRVTFSTTYASPNQGGTIQVCGIPAEGWQKFSSGSPFFLNNDVGNGNKALQHWTWADANGSVLGVLVFATGATTFDYVVFYCFERNTAKLYSDSFSNVYWTCFPAHNGAMTGSSINTTGTYFHKLPYDVDTALAIYNNGSNDTRGNYDGGGALARPIYFHPFNGAPAYDEPSFGGTSRSGSSASYLIDHWKSSINHSMVGEHPGIEFFKHAMKSQGDSKVYFQYPVYSANRDPIRRSPSAQTPFWFMISDSSSGVADSDIIQYTAPGPVVLSYLCKSIANPETLGGGRLLVAMRQN